MPSRASPVVYGALTLPYSPLSASPSSLRRSEDGQYAIVTRDEIHLLNPRIPIELARSKNVDGKRSSKSKGKARRVERDCDDDRDDQQGARDDEDEKTLAPWTFDKTVLKIDKKNVVRWSDWLDDSEVPTAGQSDSNWKSAVFSPSGLSTLGGCALATLNTNAEVLVFEPAKDGVKGEWKETFDVTSTIANELVNPLLPRGVTETNAKIRRHMAHLLSRAQATSIAWSGPVPRATTSGASGDGPDLSSSSFPFDRSILAVGHRSGEISLWRYERSETRCLKRFRVNETGPVNWINLVEWSDWTPTTTTTTTRQGRREEDEEEEEEEEGTDRDGRRRRRRTRVDEFQAQLAISDSDGRVWVQTVTQISTTAVAAATKAAATGGGGGGGGINDDDMRRPVANDDEGGGGNRGRQEGVSLELAPCEMVAEKDRRAVSQFCWLTGQSTQVEEGQDDGGLRRRRLAYTKLGTVNVVDLSSEKNGRTRVEVNDEVQLDLVESGEGGSDLGRWSGSSNWSTCAGLIEARSTNTLSIHLSSGLVYELALARPRIDTRSISPSIEHTRAARNVFGHVVLGGRDTTTTTTTTHDDDDDTKSLSKTEARDAEATATRGSDPRATERSVGKHQGPRVLGVARLAESTVFGSDVEYAQIFVCERPDLFNYHRPAMVKTHFVVANSQGERATSEAVLAKLRYILDDPGKNAVHAPPLPSLLPILHVMSLVSDSERFLSLVLDLLNRPPSSSSSTRPLVAAAAIDDLEEVLDADTLDDEVSIESRVSDALYGGELERVRTRFAIANRLSSTTGHSSSSVSNDLKRQIAETTIALERELIRTVVSRLAQVLSRTNDLSEHERMYLNRLLLASSALPPFTSASSSSPSSSLNAHANDDLDVDIRVEDDDGQQRQRGGGGGGGGGNDAQALSTTFEAPGSTCPACRSPVPFGNVRTGTCLERGHVWERCSITLEIIAKVDVRTCSECHRKALSSVSSKTTQQQQGGGGTKSIDSLLRGVTCCAYCGGRWIKVR